MQQNYEYQPALFSDLLPIFDTFKTAIFKIKR